MREFIDRIMLIVLLGVASTAPAADRHHESASSGYSKIVHEPTEYLPISQIPRITSNPADPKFVGSYSSDRSRKKETPDEEIAIQEVSLEFVVNDVSESKQTLTSQRETTAFARSKQIPEFDSVSSAASEGYALPTMQESISSSTESLARGDESDQHQERSSDERKRPEVQITGTRMRGTKSSAAPITLIQRGDIESAGYTALEQVFESLPQNFAQIAFDGGNSFEGGTRIANANWSRVSAIDLRGLGPESTLTLINGRRHAGSLGGRAVDVSAIPLSAVERVEIVTGGRSAIYGSDAVAGVANIITRRDFNGFEVELTLADSVHTGGERIQISQTAGVSGSRGSGMLAYDYAKDWALDLISTGAVNSPTAFGWIPLRRDLQPNRNRHAVMTTGRLVLGPNAELYIEGLFSKKTFGSETSELRPMATEPSFLIGDQTGERYGVSTGALLRTGGTWEFDVSVSASGASDSLRQLSFVDAGDFTLNEYSEQAQKTDLIVMSGVASGTVFSSKKFLVEAAAGLEYRDEEFEQRFGGTTSEGAERAVRAAFFEILLSLEKLLHTNKAELSLAARYDDYESIGSTFNPQAGIVWKPTQSITLRAAYSRAFRAPVLAELLGMTNGINISNRSDPGGVNGRSPVLTWGGGNAGIEPEKAKTWSVGVDLSPTAMPWLHVSGSYFNIRYDGRIDVPAFSNTDRALVLTRENQFGGLINRNPTARDLEAILNTIQPDQQFAIVNVTGRDWNPASGAEGLLEVFPDLVVFDNRINNIALEEVAGIDLAVGTEFDSRFGAFSAAANASRTIGHNRRITKFSPAIELLNELGKPVDLRARLSLGWERYSYSAFLHVNFVREYRNPLVIPSAEIDSWTTVDATVQYEGDSNWKGWMDGMRISLSALNVGNASPPEVLDTVTGRKYDASNASPFGRSVVLKLSKHW